MAENIIAADYSQQRQEFYSAKTGFEKFWKAEGYQVIDGGYSLRMAPASLLLTNSTIAPYIERIIPENREVFHDALIQKCIRLNSLDDNTLLESDEWTTGFHMAGVISNQASMAKITGETLTYLEQIQQIHKSSLFFTIHPEDSIGMDALLANKIPKDRILPVKQNGDVWVTWQFGIPGPKGTGITFLFENRVKGENEPQLFQFLNVIRLDQFVNQNRETIVLEDPVIDMGFGMERLANIKSGVKPFETVFYKLYRDIIAGELGRADTLGEKRLLTIVDNIRTIKFLLNDGFLPDKKGSEYVLRKLMRNIFLQFSLLEVGEGIYQRVFTKSERTVVLSEYAFFQKIIQKAVTQIKKLKPIDPGDKGKILAFLKDTHGIPEEISSSLL